MSTDPRIALDQLVDALREHLAAAANRRGDDDLRVERAYIAVADAFEVYEDALYTAYEEVTPFELFDDVEDAREDGDDYFDDLEDDEDAEDETDLDGDDLDEEDEEEDEDLDDVEDDED
ncbi:hypothetical protein [Sediminivirga luteola]|uniref:Primosomal protein n=1 Tax=Sediminivirga luteola TaxID=1774748 RepID=A0A8J2TWS1_9MICO|nr:hypothetical protein [Sediminivirga luteola]GGA08668.1 hypothetical protein GCM10011333_09480 [Sediminivirga luteola]